MKLWRQDRKRPLVWLPALMALGVVLAACGTAGEDAPAPAAGSKNADGYTDLSVDQLATLLETEDVTLVNVHIPYEGELPETDMFIPYNEIESYLGDLPDKEAPIVLYCRSGSMSTSAAKIL
ncbi:MAG: rhodanese-like domain-containing protein, partial [Chloroflexi bacterium]